MVGNKPPGIIDLSLRHYENDRSFSPWLQYHILPLTLRAGTLGQDAAVSMTKALLDYDLKRVEKWNHNDNEIQLLEMAYEIRADPKLSGCPICMLKEYREKKNIVKILPVLSLLQSDSTGVITHFRIILTAIKGRHPMLASKYHFGKVKKIITIPVGKAWFDISTADQLFHTKRERGLGTETESLHKVIFFKKR